MLCGGFLSVFIRVHLWPILCPRYRPKGNLHLVPLLLPFAGAAAPQTWTLANGQVAGTISFTPESGPVTQQLSDLAQTDFIRANQRTAAEFSFQSTGHSYRYASC